MRILSVQALRGPNFWSIQNPKLIQVRIQLESEVFNENKFILEFLKENVLNQHLIDELLKSKSTVLFFTALSLALQNSVGCKVNFYTSKKTIYPLIYNVVFEYEYEDVGKNAALLAEQIIHLSNKNVAIDFSKEKNKIEEVFTQAQPVQNELDFIKFAQQNNVPFLNSDEETKMQLGYGVNGVDIDDKFQLNKMVDNFSNKSNWRIPIIAVTGSNGKTTTTRLIAHILNLNNETVGFTTSDGVYVAGKMIEEGDTTGPISAQTILRNKRVGVAVLESARGGIVRAGLGFDRCDIAVATNIQDDHLGISDIETMDDLAKVKGVVVNSVKKGGVAILNADNIYTIKLGEQANCKVSWFSLNKNNSVFNNKKYNGNAFAFIDNNKIIVQKGETRIIEIELVDVPITFNGTLKFMTENVLAATLACYNYGIEIGTILNGLKSFFPSAEQTPGRMNIFEFKKCKVLIDFAHNIDGFIGIRDFLKSIDSKNKVGIIVGTGDRKDSDVIELGKISAQMFDHILIHQAKFLRGKSANELIDLLVQGINSENSGTTWERVADEVEPLKYALSKAKEGSFICALSDVLDKPIELVNEYKKEF
jgi:UDP-N-acetylmuramyl tripeptide synthase